MKASNTIELTILKDFSATPGTRHRFEGDFSGEKLREEVLEPILREAIESNKLLVINLDGTAGYGTSFLEEAFGGLIRAGFNYKSVIDHIKLISNEEEYLIDDIYQYLQEAHDESK